MLSIDTRKEIERRALEITAEIESKSGPFFAEIIPGVTPHWHLLTVHPNTEDRTADHLVERGLGVFVPRFQDGAKMRIPIPYEKRPSFDRSAFEEIDLSNRLIFPGRILIFVWSVLAHWRRIKSCSGVQGIMVDGKERPIIVPDEEISKIQIMQFSLTPQPKPKRDRHKARNRGGEEKCTMTISTKSYWAPQGEARNGLLDKALGITREALTESPEGVSIAALSPSL